MYTILIVDDETLVRQDIIYKVGASGYSFDWIMEASNAQEALEIVKANRPDLMLTDIMMRGETGLDLVEQAIAIHPKLVTCIICGYPDFGFAQRALKLGIADYLLKPVTKQQLSTVLAKLCAQVEARRSARQLKLDHSILKHRLATREFQEQIGALLSGTSAVDTPAITAILPADAKSFQIQLLHMTFPETQQPRDNTALRFGVRNIAEELGEGYVLTVDGKLQMEVVCIAASSLTGILAQQELQSKAAALRLTVEQSLGYPADMGLSTVGKLLTAAGYLEAQRALDLRFGIKPNTAKTGNVYTLQALSPSPEGVYRDSDVVMFKRFLDGGDVKNASATAKTILESYRDSAEPGIRDTYVELVGILSRVCYRKGVGILPLLGYENISGSLLDACSTLAEVVDSLCHVVETAMSSWVQNLEDTTQVLRQIKHYIDEHFADSALCTKELSKRFCISLGYLSASYKKNYEITISKYIIAQRIEHASRLLRETNFSIQLIAENSGFNNLSYFMRVFKAHSGITPTQYRDKS